MAAYHQVAALLEPPYRDQAPVRQLDDERSKSDLVARVECKSCRSFWKGASVRVFPVLFVRQNAGNTFWIPTLARGLIT